jgi:NADPH-dependent glutamate synthase beta subunit-like oxidoreductase
MRKPYAITLDVGSSLANHTGSWRTMRPVYVDRLPPCNAACPTGENIQRWLFHAEEGDYRKAWEVLTRDNPMPAVLGRVCYHPCESACNRGQLDESVGINAVERFLGDQANRQGWEFAPVTSSTGRRVLVIGAGPAGLAAAYHLRRLGHAVTLCEAEHRAGGMMRFGIPQYRLPRDVLDTEVARIVALGVELRLGHRVDDIAATMRDEGFDACFLGVGSQIGKRAYIPAGDARRITDAVSVLHRMEATTSRCSAAASSSTAAATRRSTSRARAPPRRRGVGDRLPPHRERMPAHADEVSEALEEGVR